MRSNYLIGLPLAAVFAVGCTSGEPEERFPKQETLCSFDAEREQARSASAASFEQPLVTKIEVNGTEVWNNLELAAAVPNLKPGDVVTLSGSNLGQGTDTDFSKIMLGNTRVLETDLAIYKQKIDIINQVNFELPELISSWAKDIISWGPDSLSFTVPLHASSGPLKLQIQKRDGYNLSMLRPGQSHNVIDAQTKRIIDKSFEHSCDIVSKLSQAKAITPIEVEVDNPEFAALLKEGREIFWSYDYNIGLAHAVRGLDWSKIMRGETIDPFTRLPADPELLFGAVPETSADVPSEAIEDVYFDVYPQPNPIPGFLTSAQLLEGNTSSSGFVGYRYAESSHPYAGKGAWIGFNCASCHGYKVSYEKAPGQQITKVIPGLPNPNWTMKWAILGDKDAPTTTEFEGIEAKEQGPSWDPGLADVDKTGLVYFMPGGHGEHNMIRKVGEGSETDNDYQFSPIAIPNVTNYMSIRRSLSHTESYVGFEGSYIHAEEPDGATGSMLAPQLRALTAYMTVLDEDDDDLRNAGLYRWLKANNLLAAQTQANPSEGEFVQSTWQSYSGVSAVVEQGKQIFARDCASCHSDELGAHTNEQMLRLDEVGRFFAPTIYQKDQQSIRVNFLRDVYWTQSRGLLSDGHVRNVEDLVNPERCQEGSPLYNQYYTLHAPVRPELGSPDQPAGYPDTNRKGDVFRVKKHTDGSATAAKRNRFIERHKYFVEVDWDSEYYYWDYQKMRAEYGTGEMGTAEPIGLPAAPHPWCAQNSSDIMALTQYVLTL